MKHVPEQFNTYYEPFVGGGAVLFALQPAMAVINDVNTELMNCYRVIRDTPDELVACLGQHKNEKEYYYQIRDLDLGAAYAGLFLWNGWPVSSISITLVLTASSE